MAYLSQPAGKTEYGLVKIGDLINVSTDGIISAPEILAGDGITVVYQDNGITVSAQGADLVSVHGTTTDYTITGQDEYVGVNGSAAVTITLPPGREGRQYIIKDEYGSGSGEITIEPQTGQLIDKKPNFKIRFPHQSVTVVFRNGSWWIV